MEQQTRGVKTCKGTLWLSTGRHSFLGEMLVFFCKNVTLRNVAATSAARNSFGGQAGQLASFV